MTSIKLICTALAVFLAKVNPIMRASYLASLFEGIRERVPLGDVINTPILLSLLLEAQCTYIFQLFERVRFLFLLFHHHI